MSNGAHQASGGVTYRMLRELGSRAQHTYAAIREPGELVVAQRFARATSTSTSSTTLDVETMALLLRDARCLAKSWHLNLARVRHVDVVGGELTIATELLDGSTLADLFEAARPDRTSSRDPLLPIPVLVRIALDVLAGLHALHGLRDGMNAPLGAIHGELCPANVVIGRDGVARIVNALRPRPVRVSRASEAIGYAAPEALDGAGTDDPRSDLHAVGVMLWEGLAAHRLYEDTDPSRILARQREGEVTPPFIHPSSPFARLADVTMRALAFDPALRFRTAADMAAELRRIAGSRLAPGSAVALLVSELAGEQIRARRALLDPTTSGTRRRVEPPSAPPIHDTDDTGDMDALDDNELDDDGFFLDGDEDDDLPGPRGSSPELDLESAIALAGVQPPPAIGTRISPVTPRMPPPPELVAQTAPLAAAVPPPPPNATPGDFVIPIDVAETFEDAASVTHAAGLIPGADPAQRARGRASMLYGLAAGLLLVLGAAATFVTIRTNHRNAPARAASPPPPAAVTDAATLPEATAIATTPTARAKTQPSSAASASARVPPRAAPPPATPAPAKPKKSIYDPDP